MRRELLVPYLALSFALGAVPARLCHAQWQVNGAPVCTAANDQQYPTIVSDGAGGAIVTWYDYRNGNNDIYAQRMNAAGVPQWTADGVALCTFANSQDSPMIVSDGAGGAIVTWQDARSGYYDIYAQRLNAAGAPQWTAGGVALSTASNGATPYPRIVSDGSGGAIVTWGWGDNLGSGAIYAQRVDAAGAPQWTVDGVALCAVGHGVGYPTIASDGAGGAIVTWMDQRSDFGDIYAQRVDAAGARQWALGGVALCTATGTQSYPQIASDGAGGAIVTWNDPRGTSYDIYAQRVSAAGAAQWTADGVALCTAVRNQDSPTIVSDGAGGAIVTWQDDRTGNSYGTNFDIYAQRVNAAGVPQWTADGVALCTAAGDQGVPTIVSDGAGGAIVTWTGVTGIRAQRVDAAGAPQWIADGVALCTAADFPAYPTIVSDGAAGAIVTWVDARNGGLNHDIYAQRVYGSGGVVSVPPQRTSAVFQLLAPSPNPARDGQLTIRFNLPSSERVSAQVLDLAGHRVRTLATAREFSPGPQVLGWDGKNDAGVALPSGVYFVEVREGTHSEARRAVLLH